jgi:hypothetical protein
MSTREVQEWYEGCTLRLGQYTIYYLPLGFIPPAAARAPIVAGLELAALNLYILL